MDLSMPPEMSTIKNFFKRNHKRKQASLSAEPPEDVTWTRSRVTASAKRERKRQRRARSPIIEHAYRQEDNEDEEQQHEEQDHLSDSQERASSETVDPDYGGPSIYDVISLYESHVAAAVWIGKKLRSKGKRGKRSQSLSSRPLPNENDIQELRLDDSSSQLDGTPKETNSKDTINHKPKRKKRGITQPKGVGIQDTPCSALEVEFNEMGQPIGDNSITLSSFIGALVRYKVPIIIENWRRVPMNHKENLWNLVLQNYKLGETHKNYILQKMSSSLREYRCHVGNRVVEACKLEEEEKAKKLAELKPSNLTDQEWSDFILRRNSSKFQAKSIKMKQARKKHTQVHTMSRRGYARLEQKLVKENPDQEINRVILWTEGHLNKDGKPVNKVVEESMKKIQQFNESQSNTTNSSEENDALSHALGKEKGLGVTTTNLKAQSHSDEMVIALDEKVTTIEAKLEMFMKQKQASNVMAGTLKTHDPPIGTECKLMSWYNKGEVVAKGEIFSTDPSDFVHSIPLGLDAWKVYVDSAVKEKALLWRSTDESKVVGEAVGTMIAWNKQFISFDFS